MSVFWSLVQRDLLLALRRRTEVLTGLFFMVIVASLFPLAIGPEMDFLRRMAPGILWIGALLSSLLSLPRLFEADYLDGTLEQLVLLPSNLALNVGAKMTSHWLLSGLPLVVLAPLLGLQFDLSADLALSLMLTLLMGTPILTSLGAIGAALTLGVRGGSVLLSLLVLPLMTPVLVFGAGALEAQMGGLGIQAHLSLLLAMMLASVALSPLACAMAVRLSLE
ncbi:MAG: heme exporter protein CcmB [Betaproteobacteria bacterium]|jgi:heme exporter protein B